MSEELRDATRVVRAGLPHAAPGTPYLPGPTFAAPFHTAGDVVDSPYTYGCFHNPTWTNYERALEELEGGPTVLFPSGMAATAALLGTVLKAGQKIVMPDDCYYTTRLITTQYFANLKSGIGWRFEPQQCGTIKQGALHSFNLVVGEENQHYKVRRTR